MDLGGAAAVLSLWLSLLAAVPKVAVICTSGRLAVRREREGSFEHERGLSSYDSGEVIASLSFKFLSRSDGSLQSAACHLKQLEPEKRAIE